MKNKTIQILVISVLLSGCATTPSRSVGTLGKSEYKNVVVLGEGVSQEKKTGDVVYNTLKGMEL